ncbi:MAG: sugar translocase [Candidatus Saccharibacteria bacterium]|nr:sugar translocase [Candidatus Saccharibacteria bacterium]
MKNNQQKMRFVAVGGFNTLIDIGLLFALKTLGLPVITANLISTTIAFCFSFFANKKYTFKSTDTNVKREIILFTIVTLFGLWVLQSVVIKLLTTIVPQELSDDAVLLGAKLIATVVTMIWNYVMYSRFVFVKDKYK